MLRPWSPNCFTASSSLIFLWVPSSPYESTNHIHPLSTLSGDWRTPTSPSSVSLLASSSSPSLKIQHFVKPSLLPSLILLVVPRAHPFWTLKLFSTSPDSATTSARRRTARILSIWKACALLFNTKLPVCLWWSVSMNFSVCYPMTKYFNWTPLVILLLHLHWWTLSLILSRTTSSLLLSMWIKPCS